MRQFCLFLMVSAALVTPASAIEAVRGKTYALSKQHGPWMIMVASFRNVPEDRRQEGLSAEEAAQELVFELRQIGIPAYTYGQGAVIQKMDTQDRQGREDARIYAAQREMICVLAGNYSSIEDETGQKTLKWIKKYTPKFMQDEKSGAIFRKTPGRNGPLAGAFMTINPVLKPDEIASKKSDPVQIELNSNSKYPLWANKRKYTVQVATFTGKKVTPIGSSQYAGNEAKFTQALDRGKTDPTAYNLNRAGEDAEQLAEALRGKGFEAYVHHDRFQSIVTVGGFDNPTDPLAKKFITDFGAKTKQDDTTRRDVVVAEILSVQIPPNRNNPNGSTQTWMFDPQPQLVPVPRMR